MKTLKEQMMIVSCSTQDLSYREIGRRVGCDPRTAKKYSEHPELVGKRRESPPRPSVLDPYRDQIAAYLIEDVDYRASWIWQQLRKHGYTGGYELVKRAARQIKGQRQQLAYVRFETEPAQQAQVDFGEFQVEQPDGSVKKYYLFAMILGYSRKLFGVLLERCDLPSFLEAHQWAFAHFGGAPREILYDRMRNVFIRQLVGKAEFTQGLVTLAVHHAFMPQVAPAYAAWVKGKVERPMDFVRESWWRGYSFLDLARANADLREWLAQTEQRIHGTTHERVDARFEREKPYLSALPPGPCDVSLRLTRQVRRDCTISVDANLYIVPHTCVGHDVTVRLKEGHLRIYDGGDKVEEYDAPDGKGHVVGLDPDRELQARKFGSGRPGRRNRKGRAKVKRTISPRVPKYPVVVEPFAAPETLWVQVEERPITVYARLGGEVAYA
jgi:transposase